MSSATELPDKTPQKPDLRLQTADASPSFAAIFSIFRIIGMDQVVDPLCCSTHSW